jgi:4-hydroxy-tetrahydrodipicolinate synthase
MVNRRQVKGLVVPVITPVLDDDSVDVGAFGKLLDRLVRSGVDGIFVGGTVGEGPLLADDQWQRMVETAREAVGRSPVPLLAGAMDTSTRRVCRKIKILRDLGYEHFVVTGTFYMPTRSPREHLRLFGAAYEAAGDMDMVAYNIPQCTGSSLAAGTICEMARRGWIRCCKDSSGDFPFLKELLAAGRQCGLRVLTGNESTAGDALLAGACGMVCGCANYDPHVYLRLHKAALAGDRPAVAEAMKRVLLLRAELAKSGASGLSGIKYAMSALGFGNGKPVSPLEPAGAEQKARIDALMANDQDNEQLTMAT